MGKLLKPDEKFDGLPPWMAEMRRAVTEMIRPEDIRAIVVNQVERAKEGDQAAIKFVFGQLLGGESFKGATFVQNNNYGSEDPANPSRTRPGSPERLDVIRRRVAAGLEVNQPGDGVDEEERL